MHLKVLFFYQIVIKATLGKNTSGMSKASFVSGIQISKFSAHLFRASSGSKGLEAGGCLSKRYH
jgi:hypothetical protein